MVVPSAPLSPYGTLDGQLYCYAANRACFESPIEPRPAKVILLGGLSDGLLPTPYTEGLAEACQEAQWSLVQPLLTSSYLGFGHGTLERDTAELNELLSYLKAHRSAERFLLLGHSTGCQNIVHYLQHGDADYHAMIDGVVLQAPVSDRESAQGEPDFAQHRSTAEQMRREGRLAEMMPREAFWAPITAERWLDLHTRDGRDDFFSSDLTDAELRERLAHVGMALQGRWAVVAFSAADEYVPSHVKVEELVSRLVAAMNAKVDRPVAEPLILATGNHNLSQQVSDREQFLAKVKELLLEINSK